MQRLGQELGQMKAECIRGRRHGHLERFSYVFGEEV